MARIRDVLWSRRRLRRVMLLFFIALAAPSAMLTWQAYSRLKWESFHQHQLLAEELRQRIDRRIGDLVAKEEARSVADYDFLLVKGKSTTRYEQRSPLSGFPVVNEIPGLLGYFQIDAQGRFTTPLLPADDALSPMAQGIDPAELAERRRLRAHLLRILTGERLTAQAGEKLSARQSAVPGTKGHSANARLLEEGAMHAARLSRPADTDLLGDHATKRFANDATSRPSSAPPAEETLDRSEIRERALAQAAFDRLADEAEAQRSTAERWPRGSIGRVDELKLDSAFAQRRSAGRPAEPAAAATPRPAAPPPHLEPPVRATRFDEASRTAKTAEEEARAEPTRAPRVRFFQNEIDPFAFGLLDPDHFVLYRKIWREGERLIQGALVEREALLEGLITQPFETSSLSAMSRLAVAFEGDILSALGADLPERYPPSAETLSGTLLYRSRLSAPLDRLELVFTVTSMPAGEGGRLIAWAALVLAFILSGGLYLIYRLGVRQIELQRQQRDFVSAVGHELKTPLTSIRMYSEMLRAGWVDEERRRSYYAFIHDESERLSRLIANVLQLARLGRGELEVAPHALPVTQLLGLIRSKIATQTERAGFSLRVRCSADAEAETVLTDEDAFVQILINLVDNAIKFSAKAPQKVIDIDCSRLGDGRVQFSVRDYGPGIPKQQMKKIFLLFYRPEDELTRETVGTGIGLALVQRLVQAMNGVVDVVNCDPGAEFRVVLPRAG